MKKGLNSNHLKLIACITMLIDHIAASILLYWILQCNASGEVYDIYRIMRYIGRMAFPVYCFFIVEGFNYTHSKKDYCLRLLLLAILSEVPFDYALNDGKLWDISSNNVFWTLLLSLLCIWLVDEVNKRFLSQEIVDKVKTIILDTLIVTGFCAIAYFGHTDYRAAGIAAVVAIYFLYNQRLLAFAAAVLLLAGISSSTELVALVMLIPMYFYNGERGKKTPAIQWGFYLFYPVHLSIIGLILNFVIR